MRRSTGVLVGVLIALIVAGVAVITDSSSPEPGQPVGTWQEPAAGSRVPASVARPLASEARAQAASGRRQVGKVTSITKTIGYASR